MTKKQKLRNTDCFNKKDKKGLLKYNSKIYKTIRKELCRIMGKSIDEIKKKDFKKHVLVEELAVVNTNKKDLKTLETTMINLKDDWCLNSIN